VLNYHPKSVLCLPILRQGNLSAIIYFENNLTTNAFKEEHIELLKILASQAAISLENAVLVGDIEKHHERYRHLVETMNDGLGVLDADGRFDYVNDSFCKMIGYPQEEIIGNGLPDFLDDSNKQLFETEFSKRQPADHTIYELDWKGKDGSPVSTLMSPKPLFNTEGQFKGSVAIITNITELKKSQKEKELIQAQLLQSQKMETVGKLAGGIAHDFNNYLTVIMGYIHMLMLKTDKDDQQIKYLKEIQKAAEGSAAVTHQLLAFSRKQVLRISAVNLNDVVSRMENLLRRIIGEDITFNTVLDPNLLPINADVGQMDQVIMNLSVNARDAMPDGGVLTIKTGNVVIDEWYCRQITYARPGKFVCLTIEDTGSGIEPELVQNIFEPFFTTKGVGQGTGLGLSVVFGVIKQHEGWINVTSELGKGTQFKVYLPVAKGKTDADSPISSAMPDGIPSDYQGNGEHILVIEDQMEVRQFIVDVLTMSGYHVTEVESLKEARRCIDSRSKPFDLLFSDVVLPDGNGIDFAKRIVRQIPDIRVLISSGYTRIGHKVDATNHGRFHFLQKPYPLEKLLEMIHQALGK
jgi:PAS domain S-box-containing protein